MKRVFINIDQPPQTQPLGSYRSKRMKTRQDSQVEKIFEKYMNQCASHELTPAHVTEFIRLRPDLSHVEKLFYETVKAKAPQTIRFPLLSYTLNQMLTYSDLMRICQSNFREVKDNLKQTFDDAISRGRADVTVFPIIDKLLALDLSAEEIASLALNMIELGANRMASNTVLIQALKEKNPSLENLSALLEYYLQTDPEDSLLYPSLAKTLVEMFIAKTPPAASLENFLLLASEASNSDDILSLLLDAILEHEPTLPFLLRLTNLPKIVSLFDELAKLTRPLVKAFILESDDPDLSAFSLDFFERSHPDLCDQVISWIARFEKGLIYTDDFKDEDTRGSFVSSVIAILKFAQDNEEFREYCSTELTEALATCIDQASLSVNNLLLQKEVIESRGKPLNEMLPIFRRKIAIEALRAFAKSYVEIQDLILETDPDTAGNDDWIQNTRPDATVVQLDLECRLKDELDLKRVVSKHLYASGLEDDDVENALDTVMSIIYNNDAFAFHLVQKEPHGTKSIWVQEMLKKEEFALQGQVTESQAPLFELQASAKKVSDEQTANRELEEGEIDERLEEAEDRWTQLFSSLSNNQRELFQECLEEGPVSTLYQRRSRAILELFDFAEREVVRAKTLEILNAG